MTGEKSPEEVAHWRQEQRRKLLDARKQITAADRGRIDTGLSDNLARFLHDRLSAGDVISFYWPIKGEPDLRSLMRRLHDDGMTIAMPLVETRAAPLTFRLWTPQTAMVRGHWNILVPPPDAPRLVPAITLAPLVGWDAAGFRLGYGGGYFDRTLAALHPAPLSIGIGLDRAELLTIHPQPHDIRLSAIITETATHQH